MAPPCVIVKCVRYYWARGGAQLATIRKTKFVEGFQQVDGPWNTERGVQPKATDHKQRTIARSVVFEGVGLHSGAPCSAQVLPAAPDAGISFRVLHNERISGSDCDLKLGANDQVCCSFALDATRVCETRLGTTIEGCDGCRVSTIEHLIAALAICQIDNAIIEVSGPEVPILDGSALPFCIALEQAGIAEQNARRSFFVVAQPFSFNIGDSSISVTPSDEFEADVSIAFSECAIQEQRIRFKLDDEGLMQRIGRARTFCQFKDVKALRRAGLARGGSLDNAIVVDGADILNEGGLRDPEEFVAHKALDMIGDFYLLGGPLIGSVRAVRPGHEVNNQFLRAITATPGVLKKVSADIDSGEACVA